MRHRVQIALMVVIGGCNAPAATAPRPPNPSTATASNYTGPDAGTPPDAAAPPTAAPMLPTHHELGAVTPGLVVTNIDEALEYYRRTFGAKTRSIQRDGSTTVYAEIQLGDSVVMLRRADKKLGLRSAKKLGAAVGYLNLYVQDVDARFAQAALFAVVVDNLRNQEDGDRWGMVRDRYGHFWGIGETQVQVRDSQLQNLDGARRIGAGRAHLQKMLDSMWPYASPVASHRPDGLSDVTANLYLADVERSHSGYVQQFGLEIRYRERAADKTLLRVQAQRRNATLIFEHQDWDPRYNRVNRPPVVAGGTSLFCYVYVDDLDKTVGLMSAAGGTVVTAPTQAAWGDRYAEVRDASGHVWVVAARATAP